MGQIVDWNKKELLQICKHEWCNDLLRPTSFDLQIFLNFFAITSIHYLLKNF